MKKVGAAAVAFVLGLCAIAWADHVSPVVYGDEDGEENNPSCAFLDPSWNEVRVNEAPDGAHADNDGALVFTVKDSDGKVFDWTSNIGIDAVVVKGGNRGSNVYFYEGEAKADQNLRSPDNTKGNTPAVSHISACYDEEPENDEGDQPEQPQQPEQPENDEGDQPSQPEQPDDDGDSPNQRPSEPEEPEEPENGGGDQPSEPDQPDQPEDNNQNQRPSEPDEPQQETDEPQERDDEPTENERQAEPEEGEGEEEQTTENEEESAEGEGDVEGISESEEGTSESDDDAAGEVLDENESSGRDDELAFTGAPLGVVLLVALALLLTGAAGRRATRN